MPERPAKLSLPSQLVVWGSKCLTATEKILWYHHWFLDQGREDGCYISARSLAARLGLGQTTVEDGRKRLRALGLLTSWRRTEGREHGFRSTLPFTAPRTFAEVTREWVDALDRHIVGAKDPPGEAGSTSPPRRGPEPRPTGDQSSPREESPGGAASEGGRGEGASSASEQNAQLPTRRVVRKNAEEAEDAREGSVRAHTTTEKAREHSDGVVPIEGRTQRAGKFRNVGDILAGVIANVKGSSS